MNGRVAKRLRKQTEFKKTKQVEIIGDYNINLGYRILNVPKTTLKKLTDSEKLIKQNYKKAKKQYNQH